MNVRIVKEFRPLLPAFALTVCGLIIALVLWDTPSHSEVYWGLLVSAFGSILMGIATFADEFSNRTMPLLLTQPLSRKTIWREKMMALALATGVLFGIALICICLIVRIFVPVVAAVVAIPLVFGLGVFCTTPFWTLAFKNIPAAMAGVIAMPFVLILFAGGIFNYLPAFKAQQDNEIVQAAFFLPFLLAYFSACYWGGRRLFLKMEALDVQGQDIALPEKLERSLARPFARMIPQFTGPWSSLINKELHLQRLNFIMAAVFCILVPLAYCAWQFSERFMTWELGKEIALSAVITPFVIYVILIPLIAGAGCIAEEKNWRIHEWHLTLPPSKLKQWCVKVLIALGITLVLGIFLPCIFLAAIGHWNSDMVLCGAWCSIFAACLGIFASSISTNSFRAIIVTLVLFSLGIAAALSGGVMVAVQEFTLTLQRHSLQHHSFVTVSEVGPYLPQMIINGTLLSFVAINLILFLSYLNYQTGKTSAWRAWVQSALVLVAVWISAFIFKLLAGFETILSN